MNKNDFSETEKIIIGLLKEDGKTPEEVYNTLKEIDHYKQNIYEIIQGPEYLSLIIATVYILKELKSQTIGFLNLILNIETIDVIKPGWKYKTKVIEYEKIEGKFVKIFEYFIKTNEEIEDGDIILGNEKSDYLIIADGKSRETLKMKLTKFDQKLGKKINEFFRI